MARRVRITYHVEADQERVNEGAWQPVGTLAKSVFLRPSQLGDPGSGLFLLSALASIDAGDADRLQSHTSARLTPEQTAELVEMRKEAEGIIGDRSGRSLSIETSPLRALRYSLLAGIVYGKLHRCPRCKEFTVESKLWCENCGARRGIGRAKLGVKDQRRRRIWMRAYKRIQKRLYRQVQSHQVSQARARLILIQWKQNALQLMSSLYPDVDTWERAVVAPGFLDGSI